MWISKQLVFVLGVMFVGMAGSFALSPVYGVAVYYFFAVLRPQFIWEWALPDDPGWSFYVALSALISTALWRSGLYAPMKAATPPWYGEPPYTRSHYLFLAFTAWIGLTYMFAFNTTVAWPFFLEYVKIFVMFICATFVLRTVKELWLIYMLVLIAAVYIAYEINMYYLTATWLLLQQRGYGGLDNNGAALILAMAVPMTFFAWEATRHWVRWGFLLVIPPLLHAIMLSYSRGAMLSLCVCAVLVWLRARNKAFVTVVYGLLMVVVVVLAGKEVRERFLSIGKQDVDESAQSRWTTWNIAIRMANERPLFGFGIRNSNLFTFSYGADMPGRSIHSQYLQTAADSGWVALGLYVGLLGSTLIGLRQVRRVLRGWNDPETLRVKSLASGLECALVLFAFGAAFLSLEHFEMPYILILLAVQLHAITRAVMSHHGPAPLPGPPAYLNPHPNPVPLPPAAKAPETS